MFGEPHRLLLGLLTGFAFGVLLQKGRVAKFHVIVGQLLLRDWTVAKVMLTAIVVGSVGVYALVGAGWANLHIMPLLWGGILGGAVAFGVGMAVLGYCPGTSVAACGEGRRDAMFGVLGMFFGAAVFVEGYPLLRPLIRLGGDAGSRTIPDLLGVSPWPVLGGVVVLLAAVLVLLVVRDRRRRTPVPTPPLAPAPRRSVPRPTA